MSADSEDARQKCKSSWKAVAQGIQSQATMVTLLITSFLILAGITYAVYLWQRPSTYEEAELRLPPPPPVRGLFDDDEGQSEPQLRQLASHRAITAEERQALLERAADGDKETLREAHDTRDATLYDEILNTLVERAPSEKGLLALCSYIARSDAPLRVNRLLAEKFIAGWKLAPDRNTTAQMLHVAALSDEANTFQTAIETAYHLWRAGSLTGISAGELRQLFEGEFWLLTPTVRNSGAGFVLKRRLAGLRRQLTSPEADKIDRGESPPP